MERSRRGGMLAAHIMIEVLICTLACSQRGGKKKIEPPEKKKVMKRKKSRRRRDMKAGSGE